MARLSAFAEAEQLNLDDVLTEFGAEPHEGGCPYTQQCEGRRRLLPTYRPYQPCPWNAWGDWQRCPIYRNGGKSGSI